MRINLIFYAVLEETISAEPLLLEVKNGSTAEQVVALLSENYPQAAAILRSTRLAHQDEYVGKKSVLTDGEVYCLIPPVSGG
ncbi:MAG: MoaD/ThiS family protein [SAR324 cluster bacterium]|nr:MoaD/ThiS family protein [SAR324 cluster bacterium]MDP6487082.1 MoaD/ThiS family protein [SAR324 cluster bacterium]MDP7175265.1 MoaD/ThiS family protein [SAR324 cluster bacterium]MDP7438082.1 MoaD/ThiS family protein [SAR324 cluster bacterium]MDP7583021.1 MoaD/ThiS family protein [SAR324 cluster bacterium]